MKCHNCGKKIKGYMKFCPKCGTELVNQQSDNNKPKRNIKPLAIIAGILVLCLVIGTMVLVKVFRQPNKEQLMKDGLTDYFQINEKVLEIESEFTNTDGYVSPEKVDGAINAVGEYAKVLLDGGKIKEYDITVGYSVWMKFNSGFEYVYSPTLEEKKNSTATTYQPCFSMFPESIQELSKATIDASAENIEKVLDDYSFSENLDDQDVTIDEIKNIGKKQIVIWDGHGNFNNKTHSYLLTAFELDQYDFTSNPSYVLQHLEYLDDFLNGRIICDKSGYAAVTHIFFDYYLDDLSGSMVYLGACCSGKDQVLANAFLSHGAEAVVADTDTVCASYDNNVIFSTFSQMLKCSGFDNKYDTLQTAVDKAMAKHGEYCCEENKAHPVIYGNRDFRLSEKDATKTLNSSFNAGDFIIKSGDGFICNNGNRAYYKESITDQGNYVTLNDYCTSTMSDGEVVYYASHNNSNAEVDEPQEVYVVNVNGTQTKKLFSTNGSIKFVTCADDCLYYIEYNDYNKNKLMKYDLLKDKSEEVSRSFLSGNYFIKEAKPLGMSIYMTLQNKTDSKGKVIAYNWLNKQSTDIVDTDYNTGALCYCDEEKLLIDAGQYYNSTATKINHYIYKVNSVGEIEKSAKLPDGMDVQIVSSDGKFALCFSSMNSSDFDLYKVDLHTGEVQISEGGAGRFKGKGYGVTYDLVHPESIYYVGVTPYLYDESSNTIVEKECSHEIGYEVYAVVDGYIVTKDLNTYKIQ